jgi:hypothetical protein
MQGTRRCGTRRALGSAIALAAIFAVIGGAASAGGDQTLPPPSGTNRGDCFARTALAPRHTLTFEARCAPPAGGTTNGLGSIMSNVAIHAVTAHPAVGGVSGTLRCDRLRATYVSCRSSAPDDQVGQLVTGRLRVRGALCRFRANFEFFGAPACTGEVCPAIAWVGVQRSGRPDGCR